MLTLNDGRSELWQWDTGRALTVDADCSQVHFSNNVFGRSIDVDVTDGVAIIPDILLQTDKDLNVWAFVGTAENGYTKISKTFKINRRNKPSDYVFTPQEQITLKDATAILEEAKHVANDAMETAKKAEASADNAAKIADEMKKLADQVGQNADTATKAKADALTAQTKAEEARNAAEIAKKAAEEAARSAVTDTSAASAAATRAQNAANDAAASLASIQVLYQEMQEYVSQSVQDIQTEGNTQVQRVADEGAAQISAAKEQADRAQAEADRAEAARAKAEEVVESCIPDDTAVDGQPWTSKKIVDSLCIPFEESGNPVQCYPVENYPLGVKVQIEPTQEGSGDPSPDNIRPITGRDAVSVTRCGKNLVDVQNFELNVDSGSRMKNIYINPLPPGTYTINLDMSNTTSRLKIQVWGKKKLETLTKFPIEFTTTDSAVRFFCYIANEVGNQTTISNICVELGSTATDYEPYTGSTTDIALPETVYGGTLNVESGVVTVEYGHIASYADEALPGEWISDRDVYSSGAVPTTGAQVVYKLAEPYTIQLTPQQISALSGVNTLYTDADGVIVTGAEDPKHTITELKNAIISLGGNI